MVRYALVAFAGLVAAVPLNINLGAYSPALVVGDGEISFGGKQDVSNLITALEGAAVNAAAGAANQANGAAAAAASTETPGNAAAAVVSTVAAPTPTVVKSAANDPVLADQAQQIAKLQGLGKAIAPRIGEQQPAKRDIAGFDRALKYAEVALTKGPKVQLGTGAEGSGVGIIVDNNAVAGAGAANQRAGAEKRDATATAPLPRRRAKVTTMFVRRGIPASLQTSQQDALSEALEAAAAAAAAQQAPAAAAAQGASAAAAAAPVPVAVSKRAENAFDAVNLNVDGDAGVTMTFVESVDEGADEES